MVLRFSCISLLFLLSPLPSSASSALLCSLLPAGWQAVRGKKAIGPTPPPHCLTFPPSPLVTSFPHDGHFLQRVIAGLESLVIKKTRKQLACIQRVAGRTEQSPVEPGNRRGNHKSRSSRAERESCDLWEILFSSSSSSYRYHPCRSLLTAHHGRDQLHKAVPHRGQ